MEPIKERIVSELEALLGKAAVLSNETAMLAYECDAATLFKTFPYAVAFPTSSQQVSEIFKLANRYNIPVTPRGAGTGLSGGAMVSKSGILLAMNKMNKILEIDLRNRRVVVEPGVINIWVTRAVEKDGYYYAPDPSSQPACSIGGNVAENSGGPHTLKYGVTTNHVYGLEVVLPDGEIVELGGKVEDKLGYDLVGVFVGSEGTFGVVTKAVLGILRKPQTYRTLLGVFDSVDDATQAISSIIAHGIIPAALEMMDKLVVSAVEAKYHWGFPLDAEAVLIVELDGLEAGIDSQTQDIVQIFHQHRCREVRLAKDDADRELLWKARKRAFGALGRVASSYITQDGVIPRTKLPQLLRQISEISQKYAIRVANVFHAGDGNLHPIALFDDRDPDETRRALQTSNEILEACIAVGGSVTGEHGIGVEKIDFMPLIFSPEDLALMAKIKSVFNPKDLCNPGKIFPTSTGCMQVSLGRKAAC